MSQILIILQRVHENVHVFAMKAEEVFAIASYLSVSERRRLYDLLAKEFKPALPLKKKKLIPSDEEIQAFLIKRCFSGKRKK